MTTHAIGRSATRALGLRLLGGTILATLAVHPAWAQDTAADTARSADAVQTQTPATPAASAISDSNNIIVTAQRRQESIQDVPISITAISGAQIQRTNVRGIEDYLDQAPNVSFVSNGSRDRKEISIRGISNQLDPYSNLRSSTYAFNIDEFSVIAGSNNPEVLDLERVEVLRGPQGTYFGRNSVGGAINITTRKPDNDWYGEIGLGYSSHDTRRLSAVANVPIVPDLLAVRFAGLIETSDGNIHNINPIGGGNNSNYKTGRAIVRLTPSSNITSDTTFSYTRERLGMRAGVPTGFLTATYRFLYYANAPGDVADPDGVGFYPDNVSRVNFDQPQSVGTNFWYISNRTRIDFGSFEVVGVGGYLDSDVFNIGDVDGGSKDFFRESGTLGRDSASGELRIQSTGNQRFEWSVGGNIGRDTGNTLQVTTFGAAGLFGRPEGFEVNRVTTFTRDNYYALFAQGTYHLTDRLSATIGGRYSHDNIASNGTRFSNEVQTDTVDNQKSFNDFSPRFTLTYNTPGSFLAYATISRGYKAGGVQERQVIGSPFYDPESIWNYEAGIKFDLLDRRLRFDLSAFYMDWKNIQQQVRFNFLDGDGVLRTVNIVQNAAGARSYGFDASVDFRVTREFLLSGRIGYLNARYTDFPDALVDGQTFDLSGLPLVNAPEWTLGADAEYRHELPSGMELFGRAEWNYRSSTYSNAFAYRYREFPFIAPGYHNVNLRAGFETHAVLFSVFVENLFNDHYFNNVYEKSFYSGVQVEPAFRRIGANVTFRF
jgi:iron complex outermembrane receptor protein